MGSFEDAIWTHLVDQHGADRFNYEEPPPRPPAAHRGVARAGVMLLVAAIAVTVVVLRSSTSPPPAYALTRLGNGSYTVTLYDIATAIPRLNAKFRQLGIPVTVVPVTAGCKGLALLSPVEPMNEKITLRSGVGSPGILAAEKLPDGRIAVAMAGLPPGPIPRCVPPKRIYGIPAPPGVHGPKIPRQYSTPAPKIRRRG